jgi:hypothetical protein
MFSLLALASTSYIPKEQHQLGTCRSSLPLALFTTTSRRGIITTIQHRNNGMLRK